MDKVHPPNPNRNAAPGVEEAFDSVYQWDACATELQLQIFLEAQGPSIVYRRCGGRLAQNQHGSRVSIYRETNTTSAMPPATSENNYHGDPSEYESSCNRSTCPPLDPLVVCSTVKEHPELVAIHTVASAQAVPRVQLPNMPLNTAIQVRFEYAGRYSYRVEVGVAEEHSRRRGRVRSRQENHHPMPRMARQPAQTPRRACEVWRPAPR